MHESIQKSTLLQPTDRFVDRHIGPSDAEIDTMLEQVGYDSLDALIEATIPASILRKQALDLPASKSEAGMIAEARQLSLENVVTRSFIGMGYHRAVVPPVIQRNILENPAWYTQYTPYQPEISQGRLEALLNFQTMISDLTGLEIANASLLDEGTAAAEAMSLALGVTKGKRHKLLVSSDCHPQTIAVVLTRAEPLGVEVLVQDLAEMAFDKETIGVIVQYPATDGRVRSELLEISERAHDVGALSIFAADLLSLTLLTPPGELGADIVVGSSQRFGVPMGFGGPHAAFFSTREDYKRKIPGRLVGVTRDVSGKSAMRLALQTREQHIRRDKATSNICTSQVLLAVMAGMYAVYHGPEGLIAIAQRVKLLTEILAIALEDAGANVTAGPRFDTVAFESAGESRAAILNRARAAKIELRELDDTRLSATLDEAVTLDELDALIQVVTGKARQQEYDVLAERAPVAFEGAFARTSEFLAHPTFHRYHAEHELLRYMYRLQQRDLSLTTSMIPLGSCTMKLNATAEMIPVTMEGFGAMHPFTDGENTAGYRKLIGELESMLAEITGLPGVSLQPNAGSQGEYAGLLTIRAHLDATGQRDRNICLIPSSAHGTNPASAVMAGMKVVVVACDDLGNVDVEDLRAKAEKHRDVLAALMVTYPSTHGVFEEKIVEICQIVHDAGGQVYMDGANMNAQVGLCRPGDFGVDVCHLNLHKTFCIPHGGGGPGVGPIAVAQHLRPYLPGHNVVKPDEDSNDRPVSAAPWGSAGILPISWMYMRLMGGAGLKKATQVAILNANYLAKRLEGHYDILYTGKNGTVAHEFILDLRPLAKSANVSVVDVAKRLMDYGFHAPTMSWPVPGSLMVEPTESESKEELDRFAEAMISIREEIAEIERGDASQEDNLLVNAPHTVDAIMGDSWEHGYTRERAAFPASWSREAKFWPSVGRVDDAYGDRNLMCSCPPLDEYED